jgi:hypothetical protein
MAVKSTKAIGSCVAPREDGRQAGAMRCDTRRAASSTSAPPPHACASSTGLGGDEVFPCHHAPSSPLPSAPFASESGRRCPVHSAPRLARGAGRARPAASPRAPCISHRAPALSPGHADTEQQQHRRAVQGCHAACARPLPSQAVQHPRSTREGKNRT